ncbi:hypothetical protein [Paenibacillus periandrae]|uniref:hypothetical protein n=1 Tax=Paenibacillus periandrae TaxID=1761741 RepID=UPI001F09275F|nr:hypothetical protein [Paenibacillus periandrae]
MDIQTIIKRLLALPAEITIAEENVLQAHARLIDAKDMLQQKEDSLLLGNMLDGKNAETRAAQARQFTTHEREILSDAELNLKNASVRLERHRYEFKALHAVAELLKGAA